MSKNLNRPQSPEQVARTEKRRVAAVEGAKALADFDKDAIAVRKNMERLRALRLAREAEEAANPPPAPAPKKKKAVKGSAKAPAQKLADFLASQRDGGHGT